jgi:hypothetical protein
MVYPSRMLRLFEFECQKRPYFPILVLFSAISMSVASGSSSVKTRAAGNGKSSRGAGFTITDNTTYNRGC